MIGRYFPRIGSEPFEVDYTKRLGDCRTVPLRLVEETGLPSDAMTLANLLIREVGALKRAVKYADPSLKRAVKS